MLYRGSLVVVAAALVALLSCWQVIAEDEAADWRYPKGDSRNTCSIEHQFPSALTEPIVRWEIETNAADAFQGRQGYGICIADLDSDDQLELLISRGLWTVGTTSLVSLSLSDGSTEWECGLLPRERVQWASPVVVDLDEDGGLEVVCGTKQRVLALDGATGTTEWQVPFDEQSMCLSAAQLSDGHKPSIVVSSYGDPKGCFMLDGSAGAKVWEYTTGGSAYNVPAIADINNGGAKEILFHVHRYSPSREVMLCLSASGQELWRYAASPSPAQDSQKPEELGWVPDYGYVSAVSGDFLGNGERQVYFATRCNAYLLTNQGKLIWRFPLVEGFGVQLTKNEDGSVTPDDHGTGGIVDHAAVGDVNGDNALDVIMGVDPEYRATYDVATGVTTYDRVHRNNRVIALDGTSGRLLWAFEGAYPSEDGLESMCQPILVDLDGDASLDVVVVSWDGNLYGLRGADGEVLWTHSLGSAYPYPQLAGACVSDDTLLLVIVGFDYVMDEGRLTVLELSPG